MSKKRNNADTEKAAAKKRILQRITSTQSFSMINDVQRGIILTTDGRFVKLMEFSPVNFDLRSPEDQAATVTQFAGVLSNLSKFVQFKIITTKADTSAYVTKIRNDMATEKNEKCRQLQREQIAQVQKMGEMGGLTRHFYLAFEYEHELAGLKKSPSFDAIYKKVSERAAYVRSALRMCGNEQLSRDNDDEWTLEALYTIMSRAQAEKKPFIEREIDVIANYATIQDIDFSESTLPINDFIAPQRIDTSSDPNYVIIDGLYYNYFYIDPSTYPTQNLAGWTQNFINLGENIDVDIFMEKPDQAEITRKMQLKLRLNKVKMNETDNTSQDYDTISSALDAGFYLKRGMTKYYDTFCYFGILLTVIGRSLDELNTKVNSVKQICINLSYGIKPARYRMLDAMNCSLPICHKDVNLWRRMRRNVLLSQFASAYPLTSYQMSDEDGIMLGISAQNNSPVFIDNFDTSKYENANQVLLGPSGSGKTFTLQCIALRMRQKKIQVFIIAPLKGYEFERACHAIGGQYIKIAPGSGQNINVMEIRKRNTSVSKVLDGGQSDEESILVQKIQQLHTFFSLAIPNTSDEEEQVLDEALMRTYANFGITTENSSLEDPYNPGHYKRMPILQDLHETLGKMGPPAAHLYNLLKIYVQGSRSSFNAQTDVDLDNQYIVLDVSSLTKEMMPIGMFIALDMCYDKAKEDRTKRKAIIIDETWKLIGEAASELAAEYVLELFKVIRGYGGSAIAATQDIVDFMAKDDGKYGRGIINNSRIKLLLRPEPKEAETLMNAFDLSEGEITQSRKMQRGEGLLLANQNHIFISILASKTEHDLITTDRKDLIQQYERAKKDSGGKSL